jgi:hypothetical protein
MTMELTGYAFWRCFAFSETAASFFDKLIGDMPPEFYICDFNPRPNEAL